MFKVLFQFLIKFYEYFSWFFIFFQRKRLHDSILSIISVSSTFASLNLNK